MKALLFESFGGPEVLSYRELPDPAVPPGHVLLAMRAIGLKGALNIPRIERSPLEHGADAHRRMEDRSFFGKIVLTSEE